MATFADVEESLKMLLEERGTPKNVREKVNRMITLVKSEGEARLKADRLLANLEDLQGDINIPPYVRTQVWSIAGMLEDIEEE